MNSWIWNYTIKAKHSTLNILIIFHLTFLHSRICICSKNQSQTYSKHWEYYKIAFALPSIYEHNNLYFVAFFANYNMRLRHRSMYHEPRTISSSNKHITLKAPDLICRCLFATNIKLVITISVQSTPTTEPLFANMIFNFRINIWWIYSLTLHPIWRPLHIFAMYYFIVLKSLMHFNLFIFLMIIHNLSLLLLLYCYSYLSLHFWNWFGIHGCK